MDFTKNMFTLTDGPIPFVMMGKVEDRPETAEKNAVYISTDEADGKWRVYWYDEGWNQLKGIDM